MEAEDIDQQHAAEIDEGTSTVAQSRTDAEVANDATVGAAGWGAMTAQGLHHPIIGQRTKGKTIALLRRGRDFWAIYRKHRVDPAFREEIMLAVAGADSSRQCSFAHREWARAAHLPEDELAALEGLDFASLDARTWTAIAWAQAYARSDLTDVPPDLEANLREQYSDHERSDIELAARTMYWLNETSNGVDAFLSRLKRNPVPGSTRRSELVALVLYSIAFPLLIILFSIEQPRSPVALIRGIKPFFREFEERGPRTISGPGVRFTG